MFSKIAKKISFLATLLIATTGLFPTAHADLSPEQIQVAIDSLSLDKNNPTAQINVQSLKTALNNYKSAQTFSQNQNNLTIQINKFLADTQTNIQIGRNFETKLNQKQQEKLNSVASPETAADLDYLRDQYINAYNQLNSIQDKINTNNTEIDNINLNIVNFDKQLLINQKRIDDLEDRRQTVRSEYEDTAINAELTNLRAHNAYIRYYILNKNNMFEYYNSIKFKLHTQYELINFDFSTYNERYNKALANSINILNFNTNNPIIKNELDYSNQLAEYVISVNQQSNRYNHIYNEVNHQLSQTREGVNYINLQAQYIKGGYELNSIINTEMAKFPKVTSLNSLIPNFDNLFTKSRVNYLNYLKQSQNLYSLNSYLNYLNKKYNVNISDFNQQEKQHLETLFKNLTILNNQAVLVTNDVIVTSINLQNSVATLNNLISKIDFESSQRGFFERTSYVVNWQFLQQLPQRIINQIKEINKVIAFNLDDYSLLARSVFTIIIGLIILRLTRFFKSHLMTLKKNVGTNRDSLKLTTLALIISFILSLPIGLITYSLLSIIINVTFTDPDPKSYIATYLSIIIIFYTFINNLVRDKGIMKSHFMISPSKIDLIRSILKRTKSHVYLLVIAIGLFKSSSLTFDQNFIAQILFFVATAYSLILLPINIYVINKDHQNKHESHPARANKHIKFTKSKIFITTITFSIAIPAIMLIGQLFGYLQSVVVISQNMLNTFTAVFLLNIFNYYMKRESSLVVLTLTERNEKRLNDEYAFLDTPSPEGDEKSSSVILETIKKERDRFNTSMVNFKQLLDLFILFFSMFVIYFLWSDLLNVFSYMHEITIYQSTVTDGNGNIQKTSITLFSVIVAIFVLFITLIINRNLGAILNLIIFNNLKLEKGIPYAISSISSYLIFALGLAIAFSYLGMQWSQLQWLFAALSLGLGFGLQEIFANFVSGLIILFERPIRVGDIVSLDEGDATVAKISTRATTLNMFDGKELVVPNKSFITGSFINWSLSNQRTRITFEIGVAYGSDQKLVQQILLDIAKSVPQVLENPAPSVILTAYADSSVNHSLRVHVNNISDRTITMNQINLLIDQKFKEFNISIPFPQMDIHVIDTPVFDFSSTAIKGIKSK